MNRVKQHKKIENPVNEHKQIENNVKQLNTLKTVRNDLVRKTRHQITPDVNKLSKITKKQ